MFAGSAAVIVFTVGACAAWALALWWAMTRPQYRWYHVWLLGLLTVYWWIGESIAIRLGKYEYPDLPLRVPLPWGGSPDHPGKLHAALLWLLPKGEVVPKDLNPCCVARSWDIPFPVVAIEAALLFALFHLALRVIKSEDGIRLRAAFATAGLSALLLVNVTAVLDPVVSTTMWCETTMADPGYHFLDYGLWRWFTTDLHQGYWFGVPLINYAGWFLAAATFGFVARLDDQRPGGLIRKYKLLISYVVATAVITLVLFGLLVPIKVLVDEQLIHGREKLVGNQVSPKTWQFGVILMLLVLGVIGVYRGHRHRRPTFDWAILTPKVMLFAFCLGLLAFEPQLGIFTVWVVTVTIALVVVFWEFMAQFISGRRRKSNDLGVRV